MVGRLGQQRCLITRSLPGDADLFRPLNPKWVRVSARRLTPYPNWGNGHGYGAGRSQRSSGYSGRSRPREQTEDDGVGEGDIAFRGFRRGSGETGEGGEAEVALTTRWMTVDGSGGSVGVQSLATVRRCGGVGRGSWEYLCEGVPGEGVWHGRTGPETGSGGGAPYQVRGDVIFGKSRSYPLISFHSSRAGSGWWGCNGGGLGELWGRYWWFWQGSEGVWEGQGWSRDGSNTRLFKHQAMTPARTFLELRPARPSTGSG